MSKTDYASYCAGFAAGQEVRSAGDIGFGLFIGLMTGAIGAAVFMWRMGWCLL